MRPVSKISLFGVRLGIFVLAVYWGLIFTGTHVPAGIQISPDVNDKVKHFSAFFGLVTLLCYVTNSPRLVRRFTIIALVAMTYAALDEISQQFVRGRTADPYDFLADTAGTLSAIATYVSAKWALKAF